MGFYFVMWFRKMAGRIGHNSRCITELYGNEPLYMRGIWDIDGTQWSGRLIVWLVLTISRDRWLRQTFMQGSGTERWRNSFLYSSVLKPLK